MKLVQPSLRLDKKNQIGDAPVVFRLKQSKNTKFIETNIHVPLHSWDYTNKQIKKSFPNSKVLNAQLRVLENKINDRILASKEKKLCLELDDLQINFEEPKKITIIDYANEMLKEYLINGQIGTYDKNKSVVNKISKYLVSINNTELELKHINRNFLLAYEYFIRDQFKNKTNTVCKDMKFIKKLINQAIRENLIDIADSPFQNFRIKTDKTSKTYLSDEEIEMIQAVPLKYKSKQDLHRDIFIFSCVCGGIRIADLIKLKKSEYDGTYLDFKISKTSRQLHLKVPNQAKQIIEKYLDYTIDNEFIFPLTNKEVNFEELRNIDTYISSQSFQINRSLKNIAKKAKITKAFSFHTSRHTFATRALTKGIPIEVVQQILGHANIKETLIYGKIINSELDKAMEFFED